MSLDELLRRHPTEDQFRELCEILDAPLEYWDRYKALSAWWDKTKAPGGEQPDGGFILDCCFFDPTMEDALYRCAKREQKRGRRTFSRGGLLKTEDGWRWDESGTYPPGTREEADAVLARAARARERDEEEEEEK
jgi:hypothetical protein